MDATYYLAATDKNEIVDFGRSGITLRELFTMTTWLAEFHDLEGDALAEERQELRDPEELPNLLEREQDHAVMRELLDRFKSILDTGRSP